MNGQVMGNPTVASTVALARAGDEAAFARLVAAYHADMARVAFVACGDRELAEDAVQSAWLIDPQAIHRLRHVAAPCPSIEP
jgi:DNA-directed RNA polymerase specialized sigma24 family protein